VPDHSLHFSHVSQVNHSYDISTIQRTFPIFAHFLQLEPAALTFSTADLSYGAFPINQDGQGLGSAHLYPLPDPAILTQQRKTERRRPPGKKNSDLPHIPRPRNVRLYCPFRDCLLSILTSGYARRLFYFVPHSSSRRMARNSHLSNRISVGSRPWYGSQ
jgi:hypothetical protein